MALFFVAVMAATALVTFLMPRTYRAQAKLMIRLGRENATLDPTATLGQAGVVAVPQSMENELNSAIEVLKSRPVIEQAVDAVGPQAILGREPPPSLTSPALAGAAPDTVSPPPAAPPADRDEAVRTALKQLDVEVVKHSNIILISYEGPSPELAQAFVARLTDCYLERHVSLNRTPGAHQFLADQAARLRADLRGRRTSCAT